MAAIDNSRHGERLSAVERRPEVQIDLSAHPRFADHVGALIAELKLRNYSDPQIDSLLSDLPLHFSIIQSRAAYFGANEQARNSVIAEAVRSTADRIELNVQPMGQQAQQEPSIESRPTAALASTTVTVAELTDDAVEAILTATILGAAIARAGRAIRNAIDDGPTLALSLGRTGP